MSRSCFNLLLFVMVAITVVNTRKLGKAAPFCNEDACLLPDCRCSSTEIPGNFLPTNTPQIILLTFDDAVNSLNYPNYTDLLGSAYNPSGCPIGATFFLSHEYNNYTLANSLYNQGYEIASHSITHRTKQEFWLEPNKTNWEREIVDMRSMISDFTGIPASAIKGSRAPFLLMGGDDMFTALKENGFEWDCTWSTRNFINPGMWPYTLDYRSFQDCQIGRCPVESFPGTWVVPMVDLMDSTGNPCAMLDTCSPGTTAEEVTSFLTSNFNTHYNGNRSPFGLFLHASWFLNKKNFDGYKSFLDSIAAYDDVYVVTVSQLLEWVRNPVPLSEIGGFEPWGCNPPTPIPCTHNRCAYSADFTPFGSERIMSICNRGCPPFYPWFNNIRGTNPPTTWVP